MLTAILAGAILLSLLNPGSTAAMGGLTYTISSSGALPGSFVTLVTLAPVGWLAFLLWRQRLQFVWVDAVFFLFVLARFASVLQVTWLEDAVIYDMVTFLVAAFVYYPFGRVLFAFGAGSSRVTSAFTIALLTILPIYWLSPALRNMWDRTVLGDGSAVGLSQGLTTAAACSIGWIALAMAPGSTAVLTGPRRVVAATAGLAFLAALLPLILQNGSRGSLAALLVTALLALYRLARNRRRTPLILAGLAAILALAAADLDGSRLDPDTRYGRTALLILSNLGVSDATVSQTSDPALMARMLAQEWAIDVFVDEPVFGCGYGCSIVSGPEGNYVHNLFLEAAAEGGLISLVPTMILMSIGVVLALRCLWNSTLPGAVVMSTLFLGLFIQFQVSFTISYGRVLFFALGAVISSGALLRSALQNEAQSPSFDANRTSDPEPAFRGTHDR